jgi:hypothetical protein
MPGLTSEIHHEVRLDPGMSYSFVETVALDAFTFGADPRFSVEAWDIKDPFDPFALRLLGDKEVNLAPSGYTFELMPMPGIRSALEFAGWNFVGMRIPHRTQLAVMAKITNPYDTDLPPIGMGLCFFDFDHCYVRHESPDSTPVLKPGATAYLEMEFPLDTQGSYFDWWGQRLVGLSVCGERSFFSNHCGHERVLITANYGVDCTVRDANVGTVTQAVEHDCGPLNDGSAHRFVARAGETYRVSLVSGGGSVFITDADGAPDGRFGPTEMTISRDGTYYVVGLHRSTQAFLLQRLP